MRRDPRDFSRGGPLQPELLTTLLLYMVADGNRRGYRHLLDAFWDEARSYGLDLPTDEPVSAPSFCAARHKITSHLLRHVIQEIASTAIETAFDAQRWRDRRVFAVDGTKINLQRNPDLEVAFGVPESGYCPQVLMSVLLDVCAKAPVDVQVSAFASSERDHLFEMLHGLAPGDVLVLDRGYPSHELLQTLVQEKIDFLIRTPSTNTFAVIDELREDGGDDALFWVDPPEGSPPEWKRLPLRVVRIKAPDGTESFFITTLRRSDFSLTELRELYHMRWEAEEFFKLFKGPYVGQGQFRSKTPSGIVQEIHALTLFLSISRYLMAMAAAVDARDISEIGQKAAVLATADYVVRIFLQDDEKVALQRLRDLLSRIAEHRYRKRPGRSFPRRSFKPNRKWGPEGHRGG